MKLQRAAIVLLLSVLPIGPALAADAVKPGRWEFTSQMQAPAMPQQPAGVQPRPGGGMGVSHTSCVEPDKAVPTDPRRDCKIDRMQRNGATVTWSTTCTTQQGAVRSEGVARYSGDTMEATVTTHIPQGDGKTMQTSQRITGRYLGPCAAK